MFFLFLAFALKVALTLGDNGFALAIILLSL